MLAGIKMRLFRALTNSVTRTSGVDSPMTSPWYSSRKDSKFTWMTKGKVERQAERTMQVLITLLQISLLKIL